MMHQSAFHLDCTAIFPECRFDCAKCLREIGSVFGQIPGVNGVRMEGEGADAMLIVMHDPLQITEEQLLTVFGGLPSFYRASFIPTLMG